MFVFKSGDWHQEDPRRAGVPVFQPVDFPLPVALTPFAVTSNTIVGACVVGNESAFSTS